ncbi:nuclear transport factor 2 family protein [Streptomyces sp. SID13031]|uniref:nuclear transport factor 2 family protein n=1 Tax=Streptomyces sp. SID13031 TaxID=2706046 RepID=UPI0013C7045A|nr:nuclear transport factor 2 family protein [Streptomyces sp. SID13031]NEA32493.1 nuclear transport factor 2 family protein [Streptomyces sp. SID13031]
MTTSTPSATQITEKLHDYYTMVDSGDIDGLVNLFAPGATYQRPGYDPIVGRRELHSFYSSQRVIQSGHHTIVKILVDASDVAVEGEFEGRLKNGQTVELRFADFFRVDEELFFDVRNTYFFSPLV